MFVVKWDWDRHVTDSSLYNSDVGHFMTLLIQINDLLLRQATGELRQQLHKYLWPGATERKLEHIYKSEWFIEAAVISSKWGDAQYSLILKLNLIYIWKLEMTLIFIEIKAFDPLLFIFISFCIPLPFVLSFFNNLVRSFTSCPGCGLYLWPSNRKD